ncbi:MAG: hypothetical protein QXX45_03330 [Candidatus Aenigmatarchaeota archaeon]
MTYLLAVSRYGYNVLTETNHYKFIFNSNYNTFKIISSGTYSGSIPSSSYFVTYSVSHNLGYVPLVHAFCKENSSGYVLLPNERLTSPLISDLEIIRFEYVEANNSSIIFCLSNPSYPSKNFTIRYYLFEVPL